MWSDDDIRFMRRALALAENGRGHVDPNPMVGAVIVREGRIIAEGWHHVYGSLHAERDALSSCTESVAGATMYVTLEPCCHHGKQPPCTDAIVEAGISRVVTAMTDPNPLVAGKGTEILRSHGIEVQTGLLEKEAIYLNRVFLKYITTRNGRAYRGCLRGFQMGKQRGIPASGSRTAGAMYGSIGRNRNSLG